MLKKRVKLIEVKTRKVIARLCHNEQKNQSRETFKRFWKKQTAWLPNWNYLPERVMLSNNTRRETEF